MFVRGKILLILYLLISVKISGQIKSYSVRSGLNLSSISGSEKYDNFGMKMGFILGGTANYSINRRCTLLTELNLEQKGTKYKNQEVFINSMYINSAVLLRFDLKNRRKFFDDAIKFFATAGPYGGYLISAKEKGEIVTLDSITQVDNDIKDVLIPIDVGIVLGTGFFLPMSRKIDFYFDLRYSLGLLSIHRCNTDYEGTNGTFSFTFGFVKFFKTR